MTTNDIRIELPTSKSLSNRWLVLNHLAGQPFVLRGLSEADDTQLLQALLGQLRHGTSSHFYCKGAGSVARFLLAVLATTPGRWTLSGDERLCQRPMAPLIEALRSMGSHIECTTQEGYLPVSIVGNIPQHKMVELDPSASSQFVTALLLAGTQMPNGLSLTLTDRPASRPYIDMTCAVLKQAGIGITVSPNRRVYRVEPMPSDIQDSTFKIQSMERDWSSASYLYSAAALLPGVRIRMPGLSLSTSCQGDKVAAQLFAQLGVETREVRSPYRSGVRSLTVQGTGQHESSLEYNFIDCPDLLPAVLVTCATLGVRARLRGIRNLRAKESDRIAALTVELQKLGCTVTATADQVRLNPSKPIVGENMPSEDILIDPHGDHRIAMAFGVLTLLRPTLTVLHPELVSKSFPDFWTQLAKLKGTM